jgi:CheY-like chemotaxis protein
MQSLLAAGQFPVAVFGAPLSALAVAGAAAAVPVVIHLLNRRQYRVTDWAAMRFLLAARQRTVRRLRLEQWLLLAVRVLAIVLVAAAMASVMPWAERVWRAVLPGSVAAVAPTTARTHKVLVLDGSFSMGLRDADGASRFEKAKAQADALLKAAPAGDGFSVVMLGSPGLAVVPGPSDDAARVAQEVRGLRLPHGTADLPAGLNAVAEALRRSPAKFARREVYVFTDLQRSLWGNPAPRPAAAEARPATTAPAAADAWQQVTAQARLVFVDVGLPGTDNLAVTGLALTDPLVVVRSPVAVTAVVQNFGSADRKGVRAELLAARPPGVGGGEGGAGRDAPPSFQVLQQALVDVPPGSAVNLTFPVTFTTPGDHLLQLRLEPDALELDDVRTLPVAVRDTVPVLVVDGKPAADPYERAAGWLGDALDPFPEGERHPGYPARPKVIGEAQFADAALGDLTDFDAVFLCDLPRLSDREVARLDGHLRRGGGVVICLGPGVDAEAYNRVAWKNGEGLLPGRLVGTARAPRDAPFALTADEDAFRQPPLEAFASDNARAGLLAPRFRQYVRVELPPRGGAGRRVLSFVPPAGAAAGKSPDPAILELPRHRGRVILVTTTVNTDWGTWPLSPSFPPLVQELMRLAVQSPPRRLALAGETAEEILPPTFAGLEAAVTAPDGTRNTVTVAAADDAALLRLPSTELSGVYRARVGGGNRGRTLDFAVNVPTTSPGGGAESDLRRVDLTEMRAAAPGADLEVVTDPVAAARRAAAAAAPVSVEAAETVPAAAGPVVASVLLWGALGLLLVETVLAWRFGAARAAGPTGSAIPRPWVASLPWLVPLVPVLLLAAAMAHAARADDALGVVPVSWRPALEAAFGLPGAAPGEGTRWRLEGRPFVTGDAASDGWAAAAVALAAAALVLAVSRRESRATTAGGWATAPAAALRLGLLAVLLGVLLPQIQVAFEREGWPDVALVIDDSRSMSVADEYADPAVKARAADLVRAGNLSRPERLQLAQALVAAPGRDWLTRLLSGRQTKVHVYHCSREARRLTEAADPSQVSAALEQVRGLRPAGESSQLGAAVRAVLNDFRGSPLAAVVVLTDGVTTEGEDLGSAARAAAAARVPLHLVGLGDGTDPVDLALSDLRVEEVVNVNDRLVFEGRLAARGPNPPPSVTVTLSEKSGDTLKPVAREEVRPDAAGRPTKFRLTHRPTEAGEKLYVIEVAPRPGEADTANNRLERQVFVAESRRARVLYVEGHPRYEFRFLKSLLERETAAVRGNKTIDLRVVLTDADADYAEQDKSALAEMPNREELFGYDVVILGDVDPRDRKLGERHLRNLAEFVRERGGGLLLLAGAQFNPRAYRDTPLADVMPVTPDPDAPADDPGESLTRGYRPVLTPVGQLHPLFRLSGDEAENRQVWERLSPMYWSAGGVRRKLSAEVLAVHPERRTGGREPEPLPLALQQFVGAGRVLYLGFDETWLWRKREGEARFNQFWVQAVRHLARQRLGRVELRLDRQTPYRRGEPIRVTVRFPDDAPPPAADTAVKVMVERSTRGGGKAGGDTEVQTVQLSRVEGSRATYEALVTRTPEGDYRFTLVSPASSGPGGPARAEARVLPPPGEMDRLRPDLAMLERAAAESGGKAYTLADADRLPDELPAGSRVALNQPRPPWLLWNQWWVYGLCVVLLGTEWVLRKRRHLL